jgi:hypothetical protein
MRREKRQFLLLGISNCLFFYLSQYVAKWIEYAYLLDHQFFFDYIVDCYNLSVHCTLNNDLMYEI